MNRLRKAVRDYLTMRRSLGFKLVRHEAGLHEFVSFLARKSSLSLAKKSSAKSLSCETFITVMESAQL